MENRQQNLTLVYNDFLFISVQLLLLWYFKIIFVSSRKQTFNSINDSTTQSIWICKHYTDTEMCKHVIF